MSLKKGGITHVVSSFSCKEAQSADPSLNCEPDGWDGNSPPYWIASGVGFNIAMKLRNDNCIWTIDSERCYRFLSNALIGCPAGALNWNKCFAWEVGAGGKVLSLDAWNAVPVP